MSATLTTPERVSSPLGNGNTKHYQIVNGTAYTAGMTMEDGTEDTRATPDEVIAILEKYRARETELRIYYGDAVTGRSWLTGHPLWTAWANAISRCYADPTPDKLRNYRNRGIGVCRQWRSSFESFLAWAEPRWKPGLQLDRKDNDRGYSPTNCRFVTSRQNCRNRRTTKITEESARQIYALCKAHVPHREITRRFGVSRNTVSRIANRHQWQDINP